MFALINPRRSVIKAFFLAIFFHLALFSFFKLTLSVRPAPPEPFFVFLGSILTKHDLRNPGSLDAAYEISPMQFSIPDAAAAPKIAAKDLPLRQDEKPSFLERPPVTPKKNYKDTRGLSVNKTQNPVKEKKGETAGPAPLKIQLKLYPDDQN